MAERDFRALALLADALECYAATSRTGARPPDAPPMDADGINGVVVGLGRAVADELAVRRDRSDLVAARALDNLLDKVRWALDVLALRP